MKPNGRITSVLLALSLFLMVVGLTWSQGLQNAIVGEVRDPSNAIMPGATITVTNIATNVSKTVKTDEGGNYTVPSLLIGEYNVQVEAPGFKTAIRRGVIVQADKWVRVDFTLSLGQRTESVEVTADASATLLRTEDAATGMVISRLQVESLPLKGRDFVGLASLIVPGANEALDGNQNDLGRTQSLNISANGQRMFDNDYRLDGISFIASFVNGSTFIPSIESLQEVSVQTGQYSAAQGLYSGAQVDMVVKSGQNQPHGSLFEFLRNNALNARQFFDVGAPPPFRFNQFGATFGGPIYIPKIYNGKNKTFFFFGYEGLRSRRQSTNLSTVATDKMRSGDFSALLPKTVIKNPLTGQPFTGNIIPTGQIASQALKLMQYIPHENIPGAALNYLNLGVNNDTEKQIFTRIDHKISDKDSLFFRLAYRNGNTLLITTDPFVQSNGIQQNQDYVLTENHIFSPTLINEFKVSYVRESDPQRSGREYSDMDPLNTFGIGGLSNSDPFFRGLPAASISGYIGTGENAPSARLLYSNPMVQDQLMLQIKKHTLRFGGEFFRRRQDFYSVGSYLGTFTFSGILTGNAFADFLLGLPQSTRKASVPPEIGSMQRNLGAFFQDDWKISPRLTLNIGVRYERAGAYRDRLGLARNFDWSTLTLFPTPGTVAPMNAASNDFAPRLGFAYRLKGDTVIRGGFGLFYTQPTVANVTLLRNPPYLTDSTYNTSLTSPNLTLANGFPAASLSVPQAYSLQTIPWDYGPGYEQMWSLNIQQRFHQWIWEIGYVGSHTLGLDNGHTENTPPPGAGDIQSRRPLQQWADIRVFGTDGVSYYDALQTRLQTREWHGLDLITSYTWSKCIDTHSMAATSSVGNEQQEPQNQNDRIKGERGRCAIDYRQQFKTHAIYAIPWGGHLPGFASKLLGGWQISGGLTLHSGPPETIVDPSNRANTSRGGIRPNRLADGNLDPSQRTPQMWFDTTAFVQGPLYTFGNSGRNIIEAAGRKVVDFSLLKETKIHEKHVFQFRVDFFNAFNTPQFNAPGLTVGTSAFGVVSSTDPAREIQFGLRYSF